MAAIEKQQNNSPQITLIAEPLMQQLRELIENTRKRVASVVNDETTQLYWNVGNAINTFVLQGSRAEYGKQIVVSVSRQLAPIGLILCAGKNDEHVELMHLEESNIRVAEYMTMLPDKKVLEQKLQKAIAYARERMAIQ